MEIGISGVFAIFIAVLIVVAIGKGVRIVPQGFKFVVQRLGKYNCTLSPGLNFIVPFIDDVAAELTTKEIVMDIPKQEVITSDNAVIETSAVAFIQITDPQKATYGIENYALAIRNIVQTTLRNIIGGTPLDEALSSREAIKTKLKSAISDDIQDWGITLKNVEIQDINPSTTMQQAMEKQAAAERIRRAMVTEAEGKKTAAILESEGRQEAASRDAKAAVVLADASAFAIQRVSEAVGVNALPAMYLLGEKYMQRMGELALSENAKTIVLPADIQATLGGLLGRMGGSSGQ